MLRAMPDVDVLALAREDVQRFQDVGDVVDAASLHLWGKRSRVSERVLEKRKRVNKNDNTCQPVLPDDYSLSICAANHYHATHKLTQHLRGRVQLHIGEVLFKWPPSSKG